MIKRTKKKDQYRVNADIIKAGLCKTFRDRQYITCTEFSFDLGGERADVIAFDFEKGEIIEIEVKISKADLVNDKKKIKHTKYPNINKFYYCVPRDLYDDALSLAKGINSKYGVIVYNGVYRGNRLTGLDVYSRAQLLIPRQDINKDIKKSVMRRLSYENATLLLKCAKEKSKIL